MSRMLLFISPCSTRVIAEPPAAHRGRAVEAPVKIVVFYAGAEGMPVTVLPENDPNNRYRKP